MKCPGTSYNISVLRLCLKFLVWFLELIHFIEGLQGRAGRTMRSDSLGQARSSKLHSRRKCARVLMRRSVSCTHTPITVPLLALVTPSGNWFLLCFPYSTDKENEAWNLTCPGHTVSAQGFFSHTCSVPASFCANNAYSRSILEACKQKSSVPCLSCYNGILLGCMSFILYCGYLCTYRW